MMKSLMKNSGRTLLIVGKIILILYFMNAKLAFFAYQNF